MNRFAIVLTLAASAAVTAPLSAQGRGRNVEGIPPGHYPPAGMCRIWIDGVPPGRQPRPTDCATAERNRPSNARVIYGNNNRRGDVYGRNDRNGGVYDRDRNCAWYDINCERRRGDDRRAGTDRRSGNADGVWRQEGRDRSGNIIYVRRRTDSDGNVIVERARRDSFGRYIVLDRRVESRSASRRDTRVINTRNRDGDWDDDRDDDRRRGKNGKAQKSSKRGRR